MESFDIVALQVTGEYLPKPFCQKKKIFIGIIEFLNFGHLNKI